MRTFCKSNSPAQTSFMAEIFVDGFGRGGGTMMLDDVIEIKKADPDSHFKLLPCKCGSDNVAYVHYNGRGGAKWRVECFDCGHTVDKGNTVRHDAQVNWNKDVS